MANRRGGKKPWGGGKASRFQSGAAAGRDGLSTSRPGSVVNGFTMRDEARNTVSHEPLWARTSKLREKPVAFVSAGFVDPLKDIKPPESGSENKPSDDGAGDTHDSAGDARGADVVEIIQARIITVHASSLEQESLRSEAPTPGELVGERSNDLERRDDAVVPPVFFFDLEGDKSKCHNHQSTPNVPNCQSEPEESDSSEDVILFRGRASKTQSNLPSGGRRRSRGKKREPKLRRARSRSAGHPLQVTEESGEVDEEDAILADYIANMANNSEDDLLTGQLRILSQRELGGEHGAFGETPADIDEAELLSSASEASEDNADQRQGFVEKDDSEVDGDMDVEMDDETLARILARQELLGIDSDEFPASSDFYDRAGGENMAGQSSTAAYRPKKRQANNSVIEAFDDLDLTSWAPPPEMLGLPKGRRRKQPPTFNVSDSELESALRKAWERDRERKKNRKMEREALRASGLLGKNVNPDDLRVKYQTGMKLDEIKYELLTFLVSTAETIQFPPMDKQARKILHELANKFKIKSQSTGSGDQRRPVLFRTKRTVRYSENRFEDAEGHINEAAARIGRKYFHRLDAKGKGQPRSGGGGGRSGGSSAVTLREGEIAGASIPELGQENKGRAMLEKMGWAKGMSLGTLENQGILEPVVQVMKRSKAGLG